MTFRLSNVALTQHKLADTPTSSPRFLEEAEHFWVDLFPEQGHPR